MKLLTAFLILILALILILLLDYVRILVLVLVRQIFLALYFCRFVEEGARAAWPTACNIFTLGSSSCFCSSSSLSLPLSLLLLSSPMSRPSGSKMSVLSPVPKVLPSRNVSHKSFCKGLSWSPKLLIWTFNKYGELDGRNFGKRLGLFLDSCVGCNPAVLAWLLEFGSGLHWCDSGYVEDATGV